MRDKCVGTILLFFLVTVFLSAQASVSTESNWTLRSADKVEGNPNLYHFVWELNRSPYGPLDKITLHRVVKSYLAFPGVSLFHSKVIFMVPGTWNAGGWSGITDPAINPMIYLANNGYDVYTMDFRTANITDMGYDQLAENGIDVFPTTDWTYGVFREDMKACVQWIKLLSCNNKIFMSGFSRGATLMFIYASKYQSDLKGLVCLDGQIKDLPPAGTPMDEATYNAVVGLFKMNLLTDPMTQQPMAWVFGLWGLTPDDYDSWKLAGVLPYARKLAGASLPAGYPVISDYVAESAYHVWDFLGLGQGALTNYAGGYIDRDVLVKTLNEFHRYYPNIQFLEDVQLAAYDDVPYFDYDDNAVDLPAISFNTTLTCAGSICQLSFIPNMTINSDVTVHFLQGYGHMDVLFGTHSLTDVKQPLLQWLNDHN